MSKLAGKTLILTGASMGIGRALALALANAGVNLILNARGQGPLTELSEECHKLGVRAQFTAGSAGSPVVAGNLVHQARQMGEYFGFIHAAGVLAPGPALWELTDDRYHEVFEASVDGAWQLIRHGVPPLLTQGDGLAVFFGSGAAEIAQPGIGAYCAAKAAEEHLMRQLAAEAPRIASFAYRPAIVETRMQEQAREAVGGASEGLRKVFRGWKAELLTPEQAALGLVSLLDSDYRQYHGRVADIRTLQRNG